MRNTYQTDEAVTAALNTSQLKRLAYLRPHMKYIILTITLMFTAAVGLSFIFHSNRSANTSQMHSRNSNNVSRLCIELVSEALRQDIKLHC